MKKTLKLSALYFGLGISSVFAADARGHLTATSYSRVDSTPQNTVYEHGSYAPPSFLSNYALTSQQTPRNWNTFIVPKHPFIHGTFQGGIIKLYVGEKLFQEYDTSLLNHPYFQSNGNNNHNRFQAIRSILCDPTMKEVYVHGDSLYGRDYPLLKITQDNVTELFKGDIVTEIYQDKNGNVHAWTVSATRSGIMNDIQLNNQQITRQLHFYDAWRLFSNQFQRPKL